MIDSLVEEVISPVQSAKGQLRPTQVTKYRQVTGAFLADLLFAASQGRWSNRATNTNALASVPGGSAAFKTMRLALGTAGFLEELAGYKKQPVESWNGDYSQTANTSFRPTASLLERAARFGITLEDISGHFSRGPVQDASPAEALELRTKGAGGRKVKVPIDPADLKAARITAGLQRLNAHLLEPGRVDGITFAGLRRVFHRSALPGREWQLHGRYYSMPRADAYFNMEGGRSARTRVIRLDGDEVATVDISASHLTILHGLLGLPFDPEADPYGSDGMDRERVKRWIVVALGSSDASAGGPSFAKVRGAMLDRYPFLRDLPRLGIGPLDLQYHEAEILRLAMEELMEAGMAFLPVHDELMVAKGNRGAAEDALRNAFREYFRDVLEMATYPEPRLAVAD